ncbi:MAG: hypothetical protein HY744_00535 [Deltaproteobacteria bacterium]|nr:hypothetical protein [Deltaproteobacteria bacterium]
MPSPCAVGVAVDSAGNVLLAGEDFGGSVDFGGGPIQHDDDFIFVVKLDPGGNHLWSKGFAYARCGDPRRAMAVDCNGNVLLTGFYGCGIPCDPTPPPDFGGGPLSPSQGGIFTVKLDPSGNHLWSKGFGGGWDLGLAVAADDRRGG